MPPRTRAGGAPGGDDDPEPTLMSIVELNKLFKDVIVFTPQSGGPGDPRFSRLTLAYIPPGGLSTVRTIVLTLRAASP